MRIAVEYYLYRWQVAASTLLVVLEFTVAKFSGISLLSTSAAMPASRLLSSLRKSRWVSGRQQGRSRFDYRFVLSVSHYNCCMQTVRL